MSRKKRLVRDDRLLVEPLGQVLKTLLLIHDLQFLGDRAAGQRSGGRTMLQRSVRRSNCIRSAEVWQSSLHHWNAIYLHFSDLRRSFLVESALPIRRGSRGDLFVTFKTTFQELSQSIRKRSSINWFTIDCLRTAMRNFLLCEIQRRSVYDDHSMMQSEHQIKNSTEPDSRLPSWGVCLPFFARSVVAFEEVITTFPAARTAGNRVLLILCTVFAPLCVCRMRSDLSVNLLKTIQGCACLLLRCSSGRAKWSGANWRLSAGERSFAV